MSTHLNTIESEVPSGTPYLAVTDGTETVSKYMGNGSPEGVITAAVGSTYTDSSTGIIWRKATGVGNTGWVSPATPTIVTQSAVVPGNLVAPNGSGSVILCDPTTYPQARGVGLALTTTPIAGTADVQSEGEVTLTATQWQAVTQSGTTVVVGEAYYASITTAGKLATGAEVAAALTDNESRIFVGLCIETDTIQLKPSEAEELI